VYGSRNPLLLMNALTTPPKAPAIEIN